MNHRTVLQEKTFLLLLGGVVAVFVLRTWLVPGNQVPMLNDLFTAFAVLGSIVVVAADPRALCRRDWTTALALAIIVGVGAPFATLFSPYPFWGVVRSLSSQALARGLTTGIATAGGLAIMRRDGPVQLSFARTGWRRGLASVALGMGAGLPLAGVNVVALQMTTGKPVEWQPLAAAMLDALQPGIVEEVVYRFALLGLAWLALRGSLPQQAGWAAGGLALLIHAYQHNDILLQQAPLVALGMGLALAVLWGVPMTYLALRRDLESAIAFHWVVDVARFWTGF